MYVADPAAALEGFRSCWTRIAQKRRTKKNEDGTPRFHPPDSKRTSIPKDFYVTDKNQKQVQKACGSF